jgi:hypothetical protein
VVKDNIKKKIRETLIERLGDDFDEKTFEACVPLFDAIQCRRALIRKRYFEFKRAFRTDKKRFSHVESVYQTADEFDCSESFVEKCVYNHRLANVWD